MEVFLTPDLEELVSEKVRSGRYLAPSEVVQHALRLLREQDVVRQFRLEELRREVALGIESANREELVDGEEFFEQLLREMHAEDEAKPVGRVSVKSIRNRIRRK